MLFTRFFRKGADPYRLVKLPIKYSWLNPSILAENTVDDWKRYKSWFFEVKSDRILELEREVQRMPGFQVWQADFSRASIASLSDWFAMAVGSRPPTRAERKWILEHIPNDTGREMSLKYQIDEKTISLCSDIGMYLGDTLINHNPELKWKQLKGRHMWACLMAISGELRHDPAFKPSKNFPSQLMGRATVVASCAIEDPENERTLIALFDTTLGTYHVSSTLHIRAFS